MVPDMSKVVKTLQDCGEQRIMARIVYRKPCEDWATERLVEPYNFSVTDSNNLIVFTWQYDPRLDGESWRNFRVDRIVECRSSGNVFTPRIAVTLSTGEYKHFIFDADVDRVAAKSPPSPQEIYYKHLDASLCDLNLTDSEEQTARALQSPLKPQQWQAIHARLYANMLYEFSADGKITQDEIDNLTTMRIWLKTLGWCP